MLGLADTKLDVLPLLLDINPNGLELARGSQVFSLSLEKKITNPRDGKGIFLQGVFKGFCPSSIGRDTNVLLGSLGSKREVEIVTWRVTQGL